MPAGLDRHGHRLPFEGHHADEPTTALDVTTQAQVMELLLSLVERFKTSIIVVTHNLGLVTRYAGRVYVMYAGKIVESGTTEDILMRPRHPYALGLLQCVPKLTSKKDEQLVPIQGAPPRCRTCHRAAVLPRAVPMPSSAAGLNARICARRVRTTISAPATWTWRKNYER